MTNQQKTILFWMGMVLGVVVIMFFLVTIQQKKDMGFIGNQIAFTGEGKISKKPDVAMVDFSIITTAVTTKAAQDANTARSTKVYEFLKKQGVDEKDIKSSYSVQPQYSSPSVRPYPISVPYPMGVESQTQMMYPIQIETSQPKITGYQVTQSYQAKVRDSEKVSAVVDGLVTAGANQVNSVYFDFDDREEILAEAREEAIADAKDKARKLESQLGIRLGKIINYFEGGYPGIYSAKGMEMGGGDGYGGGGPIIPSGENEIVVNVTITYQVK